MTKKKATTIVTRKIRIASSTRKKLGNISSDGKGGKTTRMIIKKVIRKKKVRIKVTLFDDQ